MKERSGQLLLWSPRILDILRIRSPRGRAGRRPTCAACRHETPEIDRSDSSPRLRSAWSWDQNRREPARWRVRTMANVRIGS